MADSPRMMKRAFELARSGASPDVGQIRTQLKQEGFEMVDQHIAGSLHRQLREAISMARPTAKARPSSSGQP